MAQSAMTSARIGRAAMTQTHAGVAKVRGGQEMVVLTCMNGMGTCSACTGSLLLPFACMSVRCNFPKCRLHEEESRENFGSVIFFVLLSFTDHKDSPVCTVNEAVLSCLG